MKVTFCSINNKFNYPQRNLKPTSSPTKAISFCAENGDGAKDFNWAIPPGQLNIIPSNARLSEVQENPRFRIHREVKTRFSDIGGMFNVKKQIRNELLNVLKPGIKNSDKPGLIILCGEDGNGKTLLATAIAGEAGVPLINTNGAVCAASDAGHIRELYNAARILAKEHDKKTAIVFIDDFDVLAAERYDSSDRERYAVLGQIKSEIDNIKSKEDNDVKIITICAINSNDILDSDFMGRSKIDLVLPIDDNRLNVKARREILEIHAKDKPFKNSADKKEILDKLAKVTASFSSTGLADIMKRAYRKTYYTGREAPPYITQQDINKAKIEMLAGIRIDDEVTPEQEKLVFAHEAGHAVNLLVMNDVFKDEKHHTKKSTELLDFLVNSPRIDSQGLTFTKPSPHNRELTIESIFCDLVMNYGGYTIEDLMYAGHAEGVSADLDYILTLLNVP